MNEERPRDYNWDKPPEINGKGIYKPPTFLVVVPALDEQEMVFECLTSIERAESFYDNRVDPKEERPLGGYVKKLLVDRGSTDETVETAREAGVSLIVDCPGATRAQAKNVGAQNPISKHSDVFVFSAVGEMREEIIYNIAQYVSEGSHFGIEYGALERLSNGKSIIGENMTGVMKGFPRSTEKIYRGFNWDDPEDVVMYVTSDAAEEIIKRYGMLFDERKEGKEGMDFIARCRELENEL
jgi:glycosyltransferase involved in cell wall biosynthesis